MLHGYFDVGTYTYTSGILTTSQRIYLAIFNQRQDGTAYRSRTLPDYLGRSRSFVWCWANCGIWKLSDARNSLQGRTNPRERIASVLWEGKEGGKERTNETMCNYTQVAYCCGHCRYTVRAWCYDYEKTHKRCPVNVVAVERRYVLSFTNSQTLFPICFSFSIFHLIIASSATVSIIQIPTSLAKLQRMFLQLTLETESTNAAAIVFPPTIRLGWSISTSLRWRRDGQATGRRPSVDCRHRRGVPSKPPRD